MQPKVRKAFPDTAYWVADVRTDGSGQATVKFDYPDAITSWRATTRGVTQDTKVGSAVENTIVRKNLMVRLVVPRFFRRGDEITLSTIVQNYCRRRRRRACRWSSRACRCSMARRKDVPVPSRGDGEGRLPRARARCGFGARCWARRSPMSKSDAMELTLPVESLSA